MKREERECTVHFGDVVIYRNRQTLGRRDLIGFVIGRGDDGKMLVLWVRKGGRMLTDYHEHTSLLVMSKNVIWDESVAAKSDTASPAEQAPTELLRISG